MHTDEEVVCFKFVECVQQHSFSGILSHFDGGDPTGKDCLHYRLSVLRTLDKEIASL
ncbi:hypothetical protein F183_A27570 [Bryobacterales bacterium F-183]|nr:hypothetical protein F183_A27570 [Bryobacterales bacterium F-183]